MNKEARGFLEEIISSKTITVIIMSFLLLITNGCGNADTPQDKVKEVAEIIISRKTKALTQTSLVPRNPINVKQ